MKQLLDYIGRIDRRHLLFGVAALLLVLNLGRWGVGYFTSRQDELASRIGLLEQYKKSVAKLPQVQQRVVQLQRQAQQLEAYLFSGDNEDKIASAMQIRLQSEISNAGLEPEFIQPLRGGATSDRQGLGDIGIKIRMSGSLNDFMKLLKNLSSARELFKIESFTVKPFKQSELKIFMEVRGFYRLSAGTEAAK